MQRAKEIMTLNPHCCLPNSTVYEAVEVMRDEDCGVVPVINYEGQCVGVVTDRDLCLKVILQRLDPEKTKLQDVMTHNPALCHLEDSMDDVVQKMEMHKIRRIPVIDEQNQCVGIISEADIVRRGENMIKVSELVAALSR